MAELKPCPFCGGTPRTVGLKKGATIFYVICNDCEAEVCRSIHNVPFADQLFLEPDIIKNAAIEAWNRRAEDANQAKA